MRRIVLFLLGAGLLGGCATFKELEPEPEVLPAERGYVELDEDGDNFELDKDGKYFIRFPVPLKDRFYLLLVARTKPALKTYLTTTFDNGEGPVTLIHDQAAADDSIFLYPIDTGVPTYYWVIELVKYDLVLDLRYRYLPQWRYRYESKQAEFQEILANNSVDRSPYLAINAGTDLDGRDLAREVASIEERTIRIKSMKDELLELEGVFPPDIAASTDTTYGQYLAFKNKVDEELSFQDDYAAVLNWFNKEKMTRGNTGLFLESAPYFAGILARQERFPSGVRNKICAILPKRLFETAPYLDDLTRNKRDIGRIEPNASPEVVRELYRSCGQKIPTETESVLRFINRFNTEVDGLQSTNNKFEELKARFSSHRGTLTESFFADLATKAGEIKMMIPEPQASRFERYGNYTCAVTLGIEIQNARNRANDLQMMYQTSGIVAGHISNRMWGSAELRLKELHKTWGITGSSDVSSQRRTIVEQFEEGIFTAVRTASEERINAFIKAHEIAIDDVAELYVDSAFLPVHQLSFSSLGWNELVRKRNQIQSYLDQIKYNQFPETSIKSIYSEFTRNMRDRGVEKARAIVEHGKFYKGSDQQVQGLITECDVQAAKWIVRPAEYRKLFALPITDNKQGVNEYMFRIRLQIPSEAEFPVFDVNLKLPQEIAEKALQEQWFESITINKNPIKNEGRFRVTSPTAANNYEALITPVQMDKGGRNILEVRFKYPGFRVFEVSAMAQVPIIRKN